MTQEELVAQLLQIRKDRGHDHEVAHMEADTALLDYIGASPELRKAHEDCAVWYA